jgi:hypothetical protein
MQIKRKVKLVNIKYILYKNSTLIILIKVACCDLLIILQYYDSRMKFIMGEIDQNILNSFSFKSITTNFGKLWSINKSFYIKL